MRGERGGEGGGVREGGGGGGVRGRRGGRRGWRSEGEEMVWGMRGRGEERGEEVVVEE